MLQQRCLSLGKMQLSIKYSKGVKYNGRTRYILIKDAFCGLSSKKYDHIKCAWSKCRYICSICPRCINCWMPFVFRLELWIPIARNYTETSTHRLHIIRSRMVGGLNATYSLCYINLGILGTFLRADIFEIRILRMREIYVINLYINTKWKILYRELLCSLCQNVRR